METTENTHHLSRKQRLFTNAGPELLDKVSKMKFWYETKRDYHPRSFNKISIDTIIEIARTSELTVRDKVTKELRPATQAELLKKIRRQLFHYLFVPDKTGGTVVCNILLEKTADGKEVIVSGESICHRKLDQFNGLRGRQVARIRAIMAALVALGVPETTDSCDEINTSTSDETDTVTTAPSTIDTVLLSKSATPAHTTTNRFQNFINRFRR